jgi:hypothetical protein
VSPSETHKTNAVKSLKTPRARERQMEGGMSEREKKSVITPRFRKGKKVNKGGKRDTRHSGQRFVFVFVFVFVWHNVEYAVDG